MTKKYNNPPNDFNGPSEVFDEVDIGCNGVADVQTIKDKDDNVVWHFDGSYIAESVSLLGSTVTDAERDSATNALLRMARATGGLK